jgi:hypothetical protein
MKLLSGEVDADQHRRDLGGFSKYLCPHVYFAVCTYASSRFYALIGWSLGTGHYSSWRRAVEEKMARESVLKVNIDEKEGLKFRKFMGSEISSIPGKLSWLSIGLYQSEAIVRLASSASD